MGDASLQYARTPTVVHWNRGGLSVREKEAADRHLVLPWTGALASWAESGAGNFLDIGLLIENSARACQYGMFAHARPYSAPNRGG